MFWLKDKVYVEQKCIDLPQRVDSSVMTIFFATSVTMILWVVKSEKQRKFHRFSFFPYN